MIPQSIQPAITPPTQDDKHLHSGDVVWILTDVEAYESSFYSHSKPQLLFKVGVYDLNTQRLGFATFGKDIAYSLLRAGTSPPPWNGAQPFGFTLYRPAHADDPQGRYLTTATLVPIEPTLLTMVAPARAMFVAMKHWPNAYPGIWQKEEGRASRANAIEAAALRMTASFGAGDVRKASAVDDAHMVTRVLKRLVAEGKLMPPTGTKRGTTYRVVRP